jgi:16S rRNA (guanine527-N7)-methyltransferase
MSDLAQMLAAGAKQLNVTLTDQQQMQLLQYLALLQRWNKAYNLTAIRDPKEMLVKHVLDSLAVVPYVTSQRLLDVGTGPGIPGLILAIVWPERQIDLLDSNLKKMRFVRQVIRELALENAQVIQQRVEDYQPTTPYDGVISRAFAELGLFVSLTRHLLRSSGRWWAMKGYGEQELDQLPTGVEMEKVIELAVPHLDARRTLVVLKQERTG